MANIHGTKSSLPIAALIIGIVAIVAVLVVFAFEFSPPISSPTPTMVLPTSSPSSAQYQAEVIPPPTDLTEPTQAATRVPTDTLVSTQTLVVVPTLVSNRTLPDLIVSGLGDPVCADEYEGTKLRFSIFVRNIGRARTRDFGSFDVGVFFILGQRRYSLEEWDSVFNGVVGTSNMEVFNLNPNEDIMFTVVIDLIGNKEIGIEVVANSGENPIRETNTVNNTLIKYFSGYCY